jgi:hypothetical protein
LKEQLHIERRLWKCFILVLMVITRRNHEFDTFSQFLFNSIDVLNSDARAVAYRANSKYGLQLTNNWVYNVDINCPSEFTIINMGMCRTEFWAAVIKNTEEVKRAVRLIRIQAVFKEKDVAWILFHNLNVGLDTREICSIKDGSWECNPKEIGMIQNEGIELFRPLLFWNQGK